MTKPVFFNSAYVNASERLILQSGTRERIKFAVRWALIPETPIGPCLIDTGYSDAVIKGQMRSFGLKIYNFLLRPKLCDEGQIDISLRRYGLNQSDISAIIVTHLHADHISALRIFDNASFFVSNFAINQLINASKLKLWSKGIFPELLPHNFSERTIMIEGCITRDIIGVKAYDLFGNGSYLAVPLPGHARGHFGVFFPDEKLLYAVDVAWSLNAFGYNQKPTWLANHIADSPIQSFNSTNIVRHFIQNGYKVMLCHEPEMGAYDV